MKKTFLLILSLIAFSYASKAQTRFGIKGGVNFANTTNSIGGISVSGSSITSFHVGGVLESRLSERVFIQPNLLFSQKGTSIEISGLGSGKDTYSYLELPVNVLYEVADYFTLGGGPYLGYALSAKTTSGGVSQDIEFGAGGMKRLDYGLNFTAGYEVIDGLTISANYSLGLANIADINNVTIKNNVIGISVTKFFGAK
ncbi:porin family protein [Arcicella aquatica]|uniref:Porin family protein n=1 Tax=Arcicella aquatica TaxID=217141 RepID=A0ABU5QHV8_9BACT|nr:porin family protein [Arcicella aquatica]MEA5256329.1 porin family protein [Arcicella aquatica]